MSSAQVAPDALPSAADLEAIASLELVDEGGSRVRFGSLYDGHKTIFVFIRRASASLPCSQSWLAGLTRLTHPHPAAGRLRMRALRAVRRAAGPGLAAVATRADRHEARRRWLRLVGADQVVPRCVPVRPLASAGGRSPPCLTSPSSRLTNQPRTTSPIRSTATRPARSTSGCRWSARSPCHPGQRSRTSRSARARRSGAVSRRGRPTTWPESPFLRRRLTARLSSRAESAREPQPLAHGQDGQLHAKRRRADPRARPGLLAHPPHAEHGGPRGDRRPAQGRRHRRPRGRTDGYGAGARC